MNQPQFTVYDFLVDIIPGVIALLLVIAILPDDHVFLDWIQPGFFSGIVFLATSFVIGHFVQSVGSGVDYYLAKRYDFAYPFEQELSNENDDQLGITPRFVELARERFGDDASDTDLFFLVQSYLWTRDIGRLRRFQIIYTFHRSLWVMFLGFAVLYLLVLGLIVLDIYEPLLGSATLLALTALFAVLSISTYKRRRKMHDAMIRTMIYDFYEDQIGE